MDIKTISLSQARKDHSLMRALYSLTLRGVSQMRNELAVVRRDSELEKKYTIILAIIAKKIVGWALIFPQFPENIKHYASNRYLTYFYVNRSYRRHGIGTALLNSARKFLMINNKKIVCSAWDFASASFFKKNNVDIT